MENIYQPQPVKIVQASRESEDTGLLRLRFVERKLQRQFAFLPGQFMQVGLPGWGECPISICSSPHQAKNFFELAIRQVGSLTRKLNQLKAGEIIMTRGPFGNGFDADKFKGRPLLLISGGCGLAPLRSLIIDHLAGRLANTALQIFYGCRNEETLLFKKEYAAWNRQSELAVVLEKPSKKWGGQRGLVTDVLGRYKIVANSAAVLVGPPAMYRPVVEALKARKIKDENIFLSLEKRMYCGVGVCQHCAIGPYYVCKDGPVFSWTQLKKIPNLFN